MERGKALYYGRTDRNRLLLSFLFILIGTLWWTQAFAQNYSPEDTGTFWLWQFLGRLHPMVVHFPLSFLLFAAVLELFTLKSFHSKLRPGINLLVYAGAGSALLAVLMGWLLANIEDYGGETLSVHQWAGLATCLLALGTVFLLFLIFRKEQNQYVTIYRGMLFFTATGISVTGHFGASLTHGDQYLSSVLPWSSTYSPNNGIDIDLAVFASGMTEEQQVQLVGQVRVIFAHSCYSCHSSEKIKGELRLDERKFVFAGGESGPVVQPGDPEKSELIRRISLPRAHEDVMPAKGKTLSPEEIALIGFWVENGAPWPDRAENQSIFKVAGLAPRRPELPPAKADIHNPLDLFVDDYFVANDLAWRAPVDDRTYLRRVYLDIIGLLPDPEAQERFLADPHPHKRENLVRELLARTDDYAAHWLTFWNDALRNDYTGTGYITKGRHNITDWLYTSLRNNKPYKQFVQELLNPSEESKGFIAGIQWRGTVNASQRTEMQAAQNVGQVILGLNLKCASCHDSFISDWKLEDAYAFANVFADSALEISRCEVPTGKFANTGILWDELGQIDSMASKAEKLEQMSMLLTQDANGRMYRTLVNRIWAQLMGRGIVEPVDLMDNEPWSQDLLDWLATDFVTSGYDIKALIFKITTSKAYQLPSVGQQRADQLTAEDYRFEGMVRRRLTAEQFADAVSTVVSPVFHDTLLMYKPPAMLREGKPPFAFVRASLVANNNFLKALGRTSREVVSTSRDSQANLLQTLELTNGERFNEVLARGAEQWRQKYGQSGLIIREVYKKALGRKPAQGELAFASAALGESPTAGSIEDLFWAVLLLPEFQVIH